MPSIVKFLGYDPNYREMDSLSGRLKEYRNRHGLSPKALGEILGVSATTVRDWENGLVPSKKNLALIETLLNE